jgi:hypothetical protein
VIDPVAWVKDAMRIIDDLTSDLGIAPQKPRQVITSFEIPSIIDEPRIGSQLGGYSGTMLQEILK